MEKLNLKLQGRKDKGNLRQLPTEKNLIDFLSNDYLGLACSAVLETNISTAFASLDKKWKKNGSTGSRLLSGNGEIISRLEKRLSEIFQSESALLFNSGYNANLAVLSSIPQKGDTIICDELIHASLKDGARLSFAKRHSFRHNDLEDLDLKLRKSAGDKFVVIESVYSMDGDIAPLTEIINLCNSHGAHLILDEAHSTGIWGKDGSGMACEAGLHDKIFARIYTFGKAMGVHGAAVAGNRQLINYLINFARPFIYTTALSPHSIIAIDEAFSFVQKHPSTVSELFALVRLFGEEVKNSEYLKSVAINPGPIQTIKISGNKNATALADFMQRMGFDVRPILSPTVNEGEERLRICLHLYNTKNEIHNLVQGLGKFYGKIKYPIL